MEIEKFNLSSFSTVGLIITLMFCLSSCTKIEKEYYSNEEIKSIYFINLKNICYLFDYYPSESKIKRITFYDRIDSLGKSISYKENGKVDRLISFSKNSLNGKQAFYSNEGNLVQINNYKNGVLDSLSFSFFDSSVYIPSEISTYLHGRLVNERIFFNSNRSFRQYRFYSLEGKLIFKKDYNKSEQQGNYISKVLFLNDNKFVGQRFKFFVLVANPPKENNLICLAKKIGDEQVNCHCQKVNNIKYYFTDTLLQKGVYHYKLFVKNAQTDISLDSIIVKRNILFNL